MAGLFIFSSFSFCTLIFFFPFLFFQLCLAILFWFFRFFIFSFFIFLLLKIVLCVDKKMQKWAKNAGVWPHCTTKLQPTDVSTRAVLHASTNHARKSWRFGVLSHHLAWMRASHGCVPVNTHSTPVPGPPLRLWVAHRPRTTAHHTLHETSKSRMVAEPWVLRPWQQTAVNTPHHVEEIAILMQQILT